ncbi:glutamine synthetase, type I [Methanococcus vannielii SB]|uniref:Glutamine synthetase n=1 Tax=Methanococcus vannielii (strain ATCC 35089 / DSM 1224 / JCM 13029 / OCM 148 / SB) TaxID=406327 RepID=A6UPK6_METVS|nr:type I glutamate--ammonia ligase [Methanococcus vannielii]ABR54428.1 glutamine synthetase, type I [Methanococcus vannielii SB]
MCNVEQAVEYIKKKNVKFIRFQFVDIHGTPKNIAFPVKEGNSGDEELYDVLSKGLYFDGSSIDGFVSIEGSDMMLKPDLSTLFVLPWRSAEKPAARIICDVCYPNGKPFEGDPRGCLKKMLDKFDEQLNGQYFVGPEPEFFVLKQDACGSWVPADNAGYFDLEPVDTGCDIRKKIVCALEDLGLHVEASHHEVAAGQHEVDFRFADAVKTADNVITFKTAIKTIASQNGLMATFMPKPFFGVNGSGMHCHQSIWLNNEPSFYDENAKYQLSGICMDYIGGILEHAKSIVAVTNPTVNSYKRMVPGYEAPANIAWANSNRSAIIRVPAPRGKGTRIEFRAPDPSCNPYLAFTVMLAAGLDGVKKKGGAPEPVEKNIFKMTEAQKKAEGIESVPASLKAALEELETNTILKDALGKHIYESFLEIKTAEWDSFRTAVTDWETANYLRL